ncbi:MAG: hypothetical protein FWD32_01995, partial [Firmicutes bacterium]|nr:hypothetical protein [Bacillota bacterium]
KTADQCLAAAKVLPFSNEGYVVVDSNWKRVKIKSPAYVAVSHLKGITTTARFIEIIKLNEQAELLSYYPEFKKTIDEIQTKIKKVGEQLQKRILELEKQKFETQKDFALVVKDLPCSGFYFMWYRDKNLDAIDWLMSQYADKICQIIDK